MKHRRFTGPSRVPPTPRPRFGGHLAALRRSGNLERVVPRHQVAEVCCPWPAAGKRSCDVSPSGGHWRSICRPGAKPFFRDPNGRSRI